ncbi:unnamed protein product [Discosporangium mesarthrocarpum]
MFPRRRSRRDASQPSSSNPPRFVAPTALNPSMYHGNTTSENSPHRHLTTPVTDTSEMRAPRSFWQGGQQERRHLAGLACEVDDSTTSSPARSSGTDSDSPMGGAGRNSRRRSTRHVRKGMWKLGERPIAKGSYGVVYTGMNEMSGGLIAIKVLPVPDSDKEVHQLFQEITLMRNLSHPNIVSYLGAEITEQATLCIFQEWVPGGSMAGLLRLFGPFSEPIIVRYTRQILLGLQYLHSEGVAHRDIKGSNILVDTEGVVKVADFGASAHVEDITKNSLKGTPYFMAPEMLQGDKQGLSVDIWSLGGAVIEMLTGRPPWSQLRPSSPKALLKKMLERPERIPPLPRNMSLRLTSFLRRCFQWNPDDRPTATELLEDPFLYVDEDDAAKNTDHHLTCNQYIEQHQPDGAGGNSSSGGSSGGSTGGSTGCSTGGNTSSGGGNSSTTTGYNDNTSSTCANSSWTSSPCRSTNASPYHGGPDSGLAPAWAEGNEGAGAGGREGVVSQPNLTGDWESSSLTRVDLRVRGPSPGTGLPAPSPSLSPSPCSSPRCGACHEDYEDDDVNLVSLKAAALRKREARSKTLTLQGRKFIGGTGARSHVMANSPLSDSGLLADRGRRGDKAKVTRYFGDREIRLRAAAAAAAAASAAAGTTVARSASPPSTSASPARYSGPALMAGTRSSGASGSWGLSLEPGEEHRLPDVEARGDIGHRGRSAPAIVKHRSRYVSSPLVPDPWQPNRSEGSNVYDMLEVPLDTQWPLPRPSAGVLGPDRAGPDSPRAGPVSYVRARGGTRSLTPENRLPRRAVPREFPFSPAERKRLWEVEKARILEEALARERATEQGGATMSMPTTEQGAVGSAVANIPPAGPGKRGGRRRGHPNNPFRQRALPARTSSFGS